MNTTPLTFVYLTIRPGGIDLLARSLAQQELHNFHLVVVDGWPGRVERGKAAEYLEKTKIPLAWYGPPKPRTYPDSKTGLCNAMNTGLIHVQTPIAVFLHDYTLLAPDATIRWTDPLGKWLSGERFLVSGSAITYSTPAPKGQDDIISFPGMDGLQMQAVRPWVPSEFETFYFAGQMHFWEKINGFDERADNCICWNVTSLLHQAKEAGYELRVWDGLVAHQIDHRGWDGWAPGKENKDSLWHIDNVAVGEQPTWVPRSLNPWDLKDLRQMSSAKTLLEHGRDVFPEWRAKLAQCDPQMLEWL